MVSAVLRHWLLVAMSGFMGLLSAPLTCADIAVVVHASNEVSNLNAQDLKRIFLGRMPLFPGTGREIRAIDLPDEHPLFQAFYRQAVGLEGVDLKRYRAYYLFSGRGRLPAVAASPQDMIRMISDDPAAIGYLDSKDVTSDKLRVILLLPHTDE